MLVSAVEFYAGYGTVLIGSMALPEVEWDGPVGSDDHHVVVQATGRDTLTRVSFWRDTMPLVGEVVFDGELRLENQTLWLGDINRHSWWSMRLFRGGDTQRLVVRVDDPGRASRIDVGIDIGSHLTSLSPSNGPALFDVRTSAADGLSAPTALGLVLDGHDSAHARLSTAITILSGEDPATPWREQYELSNVVQWLRWLGIGLSMSRAEELGAELRQLIRAARNAAPDGAVPLPVATRIARAVLDKIV